MKLIFNYEAKNQIIERYILCPYCSENISGAKIGETCNECGEKLDELMEEEMWAFFDTEQIDDKIAGYFFESKNHKNITANDNHGIEVCKADIQIKGEISFEGDYPEDNTVITLKNFTTNKNETMTFEEFCETGCMHSSSWPDLFEIEQRLSLLTNDWTIHWDSEELTEDSNEQASQEKKIDNDGPHKTFFEDLEDVVYQEGFQKNDKWDGPYKCYHRNGELNIEGNCNEGYRVGEWKVYGSTGNLFLILNYKENYDSKDLEILSKDEFADGIFHGKYKRYHSNNNLEEEGSYVYGKKDGLWKKYSFQGELQTENQYKDGKLI